MLWSGTGMELERPCWLLPEALAGDLQNGNTPASKEFLVPWTNEPLCYSIFSILKYSVLFREACYFVQLCCLVYLQLRQLELADSANPASDKCPESNKYHLLNRVPPSSFTSSNSAAPFHFLHKYPSGFGFWLENSQCGHELNTVQNSRS